MKTLTSKQEKFVLELICGKSQRQAYKAAYGCDNWKDASIDRKACEMLKKEHVKNRFDELIEERKEMTLKSFHTIPEKMLELIEEHKGEKESVMEFIEKAILSYLPNDTLDNELLQIIKRRRGINGDTRYAVLERAGFKCQCCGSKPEKNNDVKLHIDHIVPYSLGGSNKIGNLQVLCEKCNISKGNRSAHNHNLEY